jgi:glycosyltransferase involved in cell wall biosynthesis
MSMTFDLLVPTRERPHRLTRLLESVLETSLHLERIAMWIYVDDDDTKTLGALDDLKAKYSFLRSIIGPPQEILSCTWNALWEKSSGDILWHGNDDMVFETKGWDDVIESEFAKYPDGIVLVFGQDGYQGENLATNSFTTRKASRILGRFVPPYFKSFYNDTWLSEVYRRIGRYVFLPNLVIRHEHPDTGQQYEHLRDNVYRRRNSFYAEATQVWNSSAEERVADAEKLRKHMQGG